MSESREVLDAASVGTAEAEPCLLHRVVRLTYGAEHAVGYRPHVGPLLVEPLGQPVPLIHPRALSPARSSREITAKAKRLCRSRCVARSRSGHIPASRFVKVVTDDVRSM